MAKVPPRIPKYTQADLWPPGSKDKAFPPAAFHPVYLDNFLSQQPQDMIARVQQYFASKGLLARMVFQRNAKHDPFRNYQDKTKLYDCLVYFSREADAQDAVKYLHRDKYCGHRLNIFPGRDRQYFCVNTTVQVVGQLPGVCDDAPAQMFEDEVRKATCARLICSARNAPNQVLLEFQTVKDRETAVRLRCHSGICLASIETPISKQRFIEADITPEIRQQMQFVKQMPSFQIRKKLMKGKAVPVPIPEPISTKFHSRQKPQPANHDHVIQAMKRIRMVAAQRGLNIDLYRAMFPNAYNQLMAVLQASYGDTQAADFLQTYVAPWQLRQNQLNPWEWMHVQLHNEGLNYVEGVIRQRQLNHSRYLGNNFLM